MKENIEPTNNSTYLSQGVDHLGFLNSQLRSLRGYDILANELIQNADDAGATRITFDIGVDGLTVTNNSHFSECQSVEEPDCPNEKANGTLCDFHRFRRVASGNKRTESGNIGAFGIGFTSVYQVTDRPQLKTGRRHWTIRPEEPQEKRIEQKILEPGVPGTSFYFPWAADSNAKIRRDLDVPAITKKEIDEILTGIAGTVANSLMFLRHIQEIAVSRSSRPIKTVRIVRGEGRLTITDGDNLQRWLIISGNFNERISRFQHAFASQTRSPDVSIAVPMDVEEPVGRLFAFLPTRDTLTAPFHINADFYPTPDRKRVLFDSDLQSEWNRTAVSKSAELLSTNLATLKQELKPKEFWRLIGAMRNMSKRAEEGGIDHSFSEFWSKIRVVLCDLDCVYTSAETYVKPSVSFTLHNYEKEKDVTELLQIIGLNIVHPDLAEFKNLLNSEPLNIAHLKLENLAAGLRSHGLTGQVELEEAPDWMVRAEARSTLLEEIGFLLDKSDEKGRQSIRSVAIALTCSGHLDTPDTIFTAPSSVRELFSVVEIEPYFLADANGATVEGLVEPFKLDSAVSILRSIGKANLQKFYLASKPEFGQMIGWLVREAANETDERKAKLRHLPIWPSGGTLHSLDDLEVPGGFIDPLGLASLLDLGESDLPASVLKGVGARTLTLSSYISKHLVKAFEVDAPTIDAEVRRELCKLLAGKRSEIVEDQKLRKILAKLPLIECVDGEFRAAREVYHETDEVKSMLGGRTRLYCKPPKSLPISELYEWLGVSSQPRPEDLLERIDDLILRRPTENTARAMNKIFVHIGRRWNELSRSVLADELPRRSWLPAQGDHTKWWSGTQLHLPWRSYLYESTGKFIEIRPNDGRSIRSFTEFLEIQQEPSVNLVVNHLRNWILEGRAVSNEVYTYLDQHSDDELVIGLKDLPCIWLENQGYVSPSNLFWNEHPFGSYRFVLGEKFRRYGKLFHVWDVKESPNVDDAIAVLLEVTTRYDDSEPLGDEDQKVVKACWSLLDGFDKPEQIATLDGLRVIPSRDGILRQPTEVFFDDYMEAAGELGLRSRTIDRPNRGGLGMHTAGVRFFSELVRKELVRASAKRAAPELTRKLKWAPHCLERVIESSRFGDARSEIDLSGLSEIKCFKVSELLTRFTVPELELFSEQKYSDVLIDRTELELMFVEGTSTNRLSRELARLIAPTTDLGYLALAMNQILLSEDLDDAMRNLSELGFENIELSPLQQASPLAVTNIGSNEHADEVAAESEDEFEGIENDDPWSTASRDLHPDSNGCRVNEDLLMGDRDNSETRIERNGDDPGADADYSANINESNKSDLREQSAGGRHDHKSNGTDRSKAKEGTRDRSRQNQFRSRLISYVEAGDEGSELKNAGMSDEQVRRRIRLDREAIKAVLQFERAAGREPEELAPNFKGYDIKSYSKAGKVERHIEVKGVAAGWDSFGVKMSKAQFETAREKGNSYWLYVVERADSEDRTIYCIQNPAHSVTDYFFDKGWKSLDPTPRGD